MIPRPSLRRRHPLRPTLASRPALRRARGGDETANPRAWFDDQPVTDVKMLPNDRITPPFQATAQATEAAITNALLAAETMTGANDVRIYALPVDRMLCAMKKYGRVP